MCFPMNFVKFLGTPFIQNTSGQLHKKEALAKVFSYEFCEISGNSFFTEHLRTAASSKIYQISTSLADNFQLKKYQALTFINGPNAHK